MNKNLMVTALLVAVVFQPVSAIPFFSPTVPASIMSKAYTTVTSFVKNHKVAACGVAALSTFAFARYKYATKEKVWVEGNCIKF